MLLPAPWLIGVALLLGLVVLLPARRLQLGGLSSRSIGLYAIALWALGFLLIFRPGFIRFLLPILLIAYLAPFVAGPDRIARVSRIGRRGGRGDPPPPPMKNVTPPDGPTGPP
jgi:hypothetical protein